METNDLLNLLISSYRDKVERDVIDSLHKGLNDLLVADADARRDMVATDIINMARLKHSLNLFEHNYNIIKSKHGAVPAIEEYIIDVQKQIQWISYKKNKLVQK